MIKAYKILLLLFFTGTIFSQVKEFDPYVSIYKQRSSEGKKKILYIGGGEYHDDLRKASILRKLLEVDHNYYVVYTEDYNVFNKSLSEYDLLLINTKINNLTNKQYQCLLNSIKNGLPVLGIHAASASFRRTSKVKRPEYYKMLGGKFHHHPKMHTFKIELKENNNILDASFANYYLHDEFYYYSNYNPVNKVILEATYNGETSPMAWVKTYGKGKVFYTALGHSPAVTEDKNFQKLILFAVNWLLEPSK